MSDGSGTRQQKRGREEEERLLAGWLNDTAPAAGIESGPTLAALDALWAEGPPQAALEAMRRALDEWWAGRQQSVIYYDAFPSPIGWVYAALSEKGVISIDFGFPDEAAYLQHLRETHLPAGETRVLRSPERLAGVMGQLAEYFRGERGHFDLPLDLSGLTPFQRRVLEATRQVPPGQVVAYKEIARRIGNPRASRAVGGALGRNPVPIIIPCHRVLAQDGSLGGYSSGAGVSTKARLLALEGVLPSERGLYTPSRG